MCGRPGRLFRAGRTGRLESVRRAQQCRRSRTGVHIKRPMPQKRKEQARAVITTQFMNEWLGKHEDHLISFVRRRHTGGVKKKTADPSPPATRPPPPVHPSLTRLRFPTARFVRLLKDT